MESDNMVTQELKYRMNIWNKLVSTDGTRGLSPQLLRELGIYGGAQGIWVSKV